MQPIIYDVAVSLDGFISGPDGDISKFAHTGPVVDDYTARLGTYSTAIMGRKTYEFGYAFGLQPGQNPYPHLRTFVFSQSLGAFEQGAVTVVKDQWVEALHALKAQSDGPIYLCGGGAFAGALLTQGLIDRLVIKRAPCLYGCGVSLFGGHAIPGPLHRVQAKAYDTGYVLEHFALR